MAEGPGTKPPWIPRDSSKYTTLHIYNDTGKYSKLYLSENSNFQQQQ